MSDGRAFSRFHRKLTLAERMEFWTEKEPTSGCWLWAGLLNTYGYGQIGYRGTMLKAHRVAYELAHGPIPSGLTLDHLCRVRCCVNPDHLEPVTNKENLLRGIGPSAKLARQTHCKRGHPLSGENLMRVTSGDKNMRFCRTCVNGRQRRYYWRDKLEAKR